MNNTISLAFYTSMLYNVDMSNLIAYNDHNLCSSEKGWP